MKRRYLIVLVMTLAATGWAVREAAVLTRAVRPAMRTAWASDVLVAAWWWPPDWFTRRWPSARPGRDVIMAGRSVVRR